jgi:hypothetical protein
MPSTLRNPVEISFADLTHTGRTVDAHYFPLGCGLVASYAVKTHGDRINLEIFKYPADFSSYLTRTIPRVACFSNFSWNIELGYSYAKHIKEISPSTIIVFGGPNYHTADELRVEFLKNYPDIDFYIDGEGEIAFSNLLTALFESDFDINKIKESQAYIPGVHYVIDNDFVLAECQPRISELDTIPSPYLTGLFDKFFDKTLFPLMQTHRGCPYSCGFCHDGLEYSTKLYRHSSQRIKDEILYIFDKRKNDALSFSDDNFGIYSDDVEIARFIRGLNSEHDWPKFFDASSAKNAKKRTTEISQILGGMYTLAASVQSTDPEVLELCKRTNVPWNLMVEMATNASPDTLKISEVILCLPGDTKEKHFKSVLDLIDLGMDEIRMYQHILLPGTSLSTTDYRTRFGYQTKFRVMPRCVGRYTAFDNIFDAFELHEVCVGHNTLPHSDYKECRKFNLMIEIFNNSSVFGELTSFLSSLNIARSEFIMSLYNNREKSSALMTIFKDFEADEESNFWINEADLRNDLNERELFDSYLSGKRGINQILTYRMVAHLNYGRDIYDFAFSTAGMLVEKSGRMTDAHSDYLSELKKFMFLKKGDVLSSNEEIIERFSYDFISIGASGAPDPLKLFDANGIFIKFFHSSAQRSEIEGHLSQFGSTPEGLGHMAQRVPFWRLYKTASLVQPKNNS